MQGREVRTVEGLTDENGELGLVQQAFIDSRRRPVRLLHPGLLVQTDALLDNDAQPSDTDIREALSGNLCRCTGYEKIMDAVRLASARKCAKAASE